MGLAKMVDAPVLLVGDIDRGGVFAQLLGTSMLLTEEEKARIKGLIINKFRGVKSILDPGIEILEYKGKIPVVGVVLYMELSLEDEDSLTERFDKKGSGLIDIVVIRYPRISNFTDFNVFEQIPEVTVRYVTSVNELQHPDLIFLPGSKNTMGDLKWMRQNGLEAAIKKFAGDIPVFGICGGYQMLGYLIEDPDNVEEGGSIRGMELLPVRTVLQKKMKRCQVEGVIEKLDGIFSMLSGCAYKGYEIHMGQTMLMEACPENADGMDGAGDSSRIKDYVIISDHNKNIYGSYVHGLFDHESMANSVVQALAKRKGIEIEGGVFENYQAYKEKQYDKLADMLRKYLNMEVIYGILKEAHLE